MAVADKKKFTAPPTNLKEAIDWVLKIKEVSAINELGDALEALLKEETGDVAVRVQDVYEKICEKFCKDCEEHYNHASYLKRYLNKLQTFEPVHRSVAETDEDILKRLKGESQGLKTSLPKLPENLKTFLGSSDYASKNFDGKGIITSSGGGYTFAYQNAGWKPGETEECAVILLAVAHMLYIALSYIHSKCSKKKGPKSKQGENGWSDMKIKSDTIKNNGVSAFGDFLTGMGFPKDTLNGDKEGSHILSQLSEFTELKMSDTASIDHPYSFFKDLPQNALKPSPQLSTTPLTSLYLISYYYITNFLYNVQSTSPATPSFLGYSGLAALGGGAYGFNLGGLGTFMSALLA
ncbi:uncharacterized protein BcabD6B2_42480 [Babesia caballi]|uniref:Uncharacterized protein n=1 Tax=Babesia caballi TaxID=5871 RepID=A0AAV4LXB5_BABCB|nr:hypothetical protein, conserved [Babesia caballi]